MRIGRLIAIGCISLATAGLLATVLDPNARIIQHVHMAWQLQDRVFETAAPDAVAQASDGSPTPGLGRSEAPGSAHFPDE